MKMMGCICSARREDAHMHFSFLTIIREYTKHQHSTKKNEENNAHAHTHTQLYTYTNTREEEERTKEQKKAESNTIREALRFSFSHSFFFLLFFCCCWCCTWQIVILIAWYDSSVAAFSLSLSLPGQLT